MPSIDHLALPAQDADAAARWLARLLGVGDGAVAPEGPDGDMVGVALGRGSVLFVDAPGGDVAPQHVAFRVAPAELAGVVARLRADGAAFGNDPEDPTNGEVTDPLGGHGRVYVTTPDGHFVEVVA